MPPPLRLAADLAWIMLRWRMMSRSALADSVGLTLDALRIPPGRTCVVLTLAGEGGQVRVWRMRTGASEARRVVTLSKQLSGLGLRVPHVRWRRWFLAGAGGRVALGLSALAGTTFSPATNADAAALGEELRRWHAAKPSAPRRDSRDPVERILLWQKRRGEHGRATGPLRWPDWAKAATAIISPLDAAAFCGPVGLSPGSLEANRPIRQADGGFAWLGLDLVVRRPVRFDLVEAELDLLSPDPGLVESFEQAYFLSDSAGLEAWRRHRLAWYRVCLLASLLRDDSARLDRTARNGESGHGADTAKRRRRAALAAAFFAVERESADVLELLRRVGDREQGIA